MRSASEVRGRRSFDGTAVAVATSLMNVATYGFTMLAARLTGPSEYGEFVSCLNLLIVIQVIALGLQATAARRIASDTSHVASVEQAILSLALKLSVGVGAVLMMLVPVVDAVLRLDSIYAALIVALGAVPLTLAGGQAGILQGERRWSGLAAMYVMGGLPRLVIGTALLLWQPSATAALSGVALGFLFPVLVGWWVLRHRRTPAGRSPEHTPGSVLRESAQNSQALFAYFALSSADIILARNVLPEHEAGLYAAGLIMAKAMLFLPQFVVVVAFPDMATPDGRQRALVRSMAFVLVVGVLAVLATRVLSGLAMVFVGGEDFAEVEGRLWLFAVLGTILALIQLQVYAVLARRGRRSVVLVWAALVAMVGAALTTSTLGGLLGVLVTVDLALVLVLTAVSLHLARLPDARPAQ